MKTQLLPYRNPHLFFWLSIAGWSLASVVCVLYLKERSRRPAGVELVAPLPDSSEQRGKSETTASLDSLMLESKQLLDKGRPEDSISRIAMLWSLCHSTGQSVPEESHEVFARAVSALTSASQQALEVSLEAPISPPQKLARETTEKKAAAPCTLPRLDLSTQGYPKAQPSKNSPGVNAHTELPPTDPYPSLPSVATESAPPSGPTFPPPPPWPPGRRPAPPAWERQPGESPPRYGPPGRRRHSGAEDHRSLQRGH